MEACVSRHMCGCQRMACGCPFSLSTMCPQRSNLGHQSWQQVPLSSELSHWPSLFLCLEGLMQTRLTSNSVYKLDLNS